MWIPLFITWACLFPPKRPQHLHWATIREATTSMFGSKKKTSHPHKKNHNSNVKSETCYAKMTIGIMDNQDYQHDAHYSWCRFFPTWHYNNQLGSSLVNQQVSSWLKNHVGHHPRSHYSTKFSRPPTHIHHTWNACGRCLCNSGWYNLHTPLRSRD